MKAITSACRLLAAAAMLWAAQGAAAQALVRDAEIEATLDRLSRPIFRAAGLSPASIDIYIIAEDRMNAFVAGGRSMVFTTGLLKAFSAPDEIMGVIAHEAGHIAGGHLARRDIALANARGPALIGLLIAAAAGAAGGGEVGAAAAVGSQQIVQRGLLAYSRAEEAAADQAALNYLASAGIDPAGMTRVLERFRDQDVFLNTRQDPYARTHPMSAERIALVRRRTEGSPLYGRGVPPDLAYWTQRMQAKIEAFTDRPDRVLSRLGPGDDELTLLRRAVALHRSPDPDGALREVDKLLRLRPNDPYYWELKGQILLESARPREAVEALRRAVSLAPDEPLIQGYLGRALLALNSPATNREALAALERAAAQADGGDAYVLRDLALAYARNGEEGMAALATAERIAITGDLGEARRHAERASALLPRGSPGWLRAGDIVASAKALRQE